LGNETDRIVNNVYTTALWCKLLDLFGPVGLAVVDGVIGAERASDILLVLSSCGRNDCRAKGFCNLYSGETDTAGCSVDEDPVACVDKSA
jgi:hypothetical protein|tara:strand:+ start:16169 stop:16438 length:270 start_codon:yes stop_codon:yes gene_type:complete